jgi:elongation factor Ts
MQVTAGMVKELRERTGAGMMDCKNALTEVDGDMDRAIETLREKGLAKAAKKAGRIASQGLVNLVFTSDGKKAAAVEVNSETDFVAKNDEFVGFVSTLATIVLNSEVQDVEELLKIDYLNEGSVEAVLHNKIATIGENMSIRRFVRCEKPGVLNIGYVHGGGRIGVIVELETNASLTEVSGLGKDIAMQIASMNPKFLDESCVDPEYIESEKKILIQQALNEGKSADIVEKMVIGRLKKELKETCLLEQKFVKDSEMSVGQYVDAISKSIGKPIKVVGMTRYEVGEGIEKIEENFADEVAKQINK